MFKVAVAGDEHGHIGFVAIIDAVLILDRSARMDDGGDAGLMCDLNTIRERKESFGGHDGTMQIKAKCFCLVDGLFECIYP